MKNEEVIGLILCALGIVFIFIGTGHLVLFEEGLHFLAYNLFAVIYITVGLSLS